MKITHLDAVRRAIEVRAHMYCCHVDDACRKCLALSAAIEQAVKETAEECARMVYERSAAEPGELRDEILAAFGIAEAKRGDKE